MRKSLFVAVLAISLCFSVNATEAEEQNISIVEAQASPIEGCTFESENGETLDFYSGGKVIYKAKGVNISRRGDYTISGRNITVNIYVGNRTVTFKGTYISYNNKLVLNGSNWAFKYKV